MESMEVCNLLLSRSFLDLDPRSFKYQNYYYGFLRITGPVKVKIYVEPPCIGKTQFCA